MKKTVKLLVILVFIFAFIPFNANASLANKKIKQAQKFYDEALELREKADNLERIDEKTSANIFCRQASQKLNEATGLLAHVLGENPRNKTALFTLGKVYFQLGKWGKTEKKFAQCATDEKMRQAIYKFYKNESNRLAGKEKTVLSLRLLRQACLFRPQNPGIQAELNEMGKNYFSQGINFLNICKYGEAYECFLTTIALNSKYSLPCAQKMIETAKCIDDPVEQVRLSVLAYKLDKNIHDLAIETAIIACEKAKASGNQNTIHKVKAELKKFNQQDYSYVLTAVWPPKSWKIIYKKTFVGVGYTGGDDTDNDGSIYTAVAGKDFVVGNRYTVIDANFEVWRNGGWQKYPKGHRLKVIKIKPGKKETFRNEKGKKFTVVFEEYK